MHPFLRSIKMLLLMMLMWIAISIGAVILNVIITKQPLIVSIVLMTPSMIVEFIIFILLWYICRIFSPERSGLLSVLIRHSALFIITGVAWLFLIFLYSVFIDQLSDTDIWFSYYKESLPILVSLCFFLYFLTCLIYYLVLSVEKTKIAESLILEQKLIASQAELRSLKALVHPHFLYNSLTALSELSESEPKQAKIMCIRLSEFFRYNLKYGQKEFATLADEINHLDDYYNIEKIRFGNRLNFNMDIDEYVLSVRIPSLTLMILAENAIKHGIQQCVDGGTVKISVKRQESSVHISVSNPYDPDAGQSHGERYGLKFLRQRLRSAYGNNASFSIEKQDKKYSITLIIPMEPA